MPRLSIIVPYRHQAKRLEATLVSVLENRPRDCEVIVVHDGSYPDPYDISDEVIFVEEPNSPNTTSLLNSGLQAACAPAICVLLDGVIVSKDWCETPLKTLLGSHTAAVAMPLQSNSRRHASWGIDSELLSKLSATQTTGIEATSDRQSSGAPILSCGFYRRKVLLAIGGWNSELDDAVADVDLALSLAALELECQVASTTPPYVNTVVQPRKLSASAISQLASLMVAHGAGNTDLTTALGSLLRNCLQASPRAGLAWFRGLRNTATIRRIQLRLNHARQQLQGELTSPLRIYHGDAQTPLTASRYAA